MRHTIVLQMSEVLAEDSRSGSPATPPPVPERRVSRTNARTSPPSAAEGSSKELEEALQNSRGKKRHRRAKGKKKKQKTSLLITNEDGTNSTAADAGPSKQQKKVFLRPSAANNPLLKAPKNSTQFIIDDHENSNLFWNFDSNRCHDSSKDDIESVGDESNEFKYRDLQLEVAGVGESPDDESFMDAYFDKDFESVYESAHQEEIYSWNRTRIIEEISTLEKRQKQLIDMLSQIDPMIYLQKLQQDLLALQEQNRQLKLVNIAERLERENRRRGSRTSSPRLPDSTTEVDGDGEESKDAGEADSESDSDSDSSSSSSDEDSDDSDDEGGCSSGCCLAQPCAEAENRLSEVAEEEEEEDTNDVSTSEHLAANTAGVGDHVDTDAAEESGEDDGDGVLNIDDTSRSVEDSGDESKF